ncbi:SusC/RagA family TonB-linked outer membrane protein [Aequorivita sp. H23M31]|uniref:SusC/RagA family TonB-linked outer membrane protein n=1 Tax=Aequorivita ciconiae TaxID=2494375 RepID=A0A410G430_9FLAO|nr:TonB-dependent receptor [Aequorivita sp. H23M31]QAA82048.1 SusC/RagA family TonB-linked outer membrane protein [Aequorivita sp. H23M31]
MKNEPIRNVLLYIFNTHHLKMKLTLTLFLFALIQMNASTSYGQNNRVSVAVSGVPLTQVFQLIEDQTDYHFFYNSNEIDVRGKMALSLVDEPLIDALQDLFRNSNISFQILGNQIVLKKQNKSEVTEEVSIAEVQKTVTGTITDKTGMPLAGVTVLIEGTNKGTVTNFDGEYSIVLEDDQNVLVFSSLGYKTIRFEVGDNSIVSLVMQEDLSQLDEVVLIGYGEQKREDVTGAVSSVKTEEVVQSAIGNIGFDRALGGLVQGVQVSQGSGRPGSPVRLNIRGITSPLSSNGTGLNQPLYVINGVPFNMDAVAGANPLLTLNPSDIESFEILKDAAATSIYGSRGANGVIIIETKRGKRGQKATVNFSTSTTLAKPINTVKVLNAAQYRGFYDQLVRNSVDAINNGQLDPFFVFDLQNVGNVELDYDTFMASYDGLREDYFGNADTDWNKLVYRNVAVTEQANFSINGGGNNSNYSLSLAAINQEGLTVKDKLKQYTLSTSLDADVNDYVKVGGSVNVSHVEAISGEDSGIGQYTVNTSIARARPDLPAYDEFGKLMGQPDYTYGFETLEPNPLMRLQNRNNNKTYNFIGNTYLEVEPLHKLKVKADVNAALFHNNHSIFQPKITQTDFIVFPNDSYLDESTATVSNVTTNLTANYDFGISDHHFNIMVGGAWDRTNYDTASQFFAGFPDDEILINASSAESVLGYTHDRLETGLNSLFSRLTYKYKNRYNATLNFRSDASSKFGPGNKRANFPSLSLGWNINNESFLAQSEKVNNLKLRASAGRVGSTNVGDYFYLQFFQTTASDIYNGASAIVPSDNFPNENIGWETTEEINLGLDFAFFNSRLRGSVDAYSRKTKDALAKSPLPLELGPRIYFSNLMDVSNKGVEVSIGGDIIKTEDFLWSANVNWAFNRNKLDKLKGTSIDPFLLDYFVEGQPVGTIKGYKVVKIFQDQAEVDALNDAAPNGVYDQFATGAGDYMYEDINGDGEITSEDRTIIGNVQPDYFGGISNTFKYKAFSLTALLQYSVGAEATWDPIAMGTFNAIGENKYSEYALNTWTPENPDARYARAVYFDPAGSGRMSDRYLFDTSYLRLKSLQLSYDFDSYLMDKLGMKSAKIMLTASNLITWTKWPGIDPETLSERGSITDQVSSEDPYPLSKSFSIGLQFQF